MNFIIRCCFFIGLVLPSSCADSGSIPIPILPNQHDAYLVYRGTHTKQGRIASGYNLHNTKVSHVGILLPCGEIWRVFHVVDQPERTSAFIGEDLSDFFRSHKDEVYYASLWKIENLLSSEIYSICAYVSQLMQQTVVFDYSFSQNGPYSLYCSEFVHEALLRANRSEFYMEPQRVVLNPVHARFVRNDSLVYFPVDIFQKLPRIKMIWSWTKKGH